MKASAVLPAMLAVAACTHSGNYVSTHDPRFLNYDQRHALRLEQGEAQLPILVGASARELTGGDRTALSGFVQSYLMQGEGPLRIRVPTGSENAAAARRALADIHDVVAGAGANPAHVLVEHYSVHQPEAHAPIVATYDRLVARTNECGTWSDRLNAPLEQSDYYNFGCATQANLAATLADPRDLVRPRGVGYPDAGRRAEVLALYRAGQPTATAQGEGSQATVADVAQ